MRKKIKRIKNGITLLLSVIVIVIGVYSNQITDNKNKNTINCTNEFYEISNIPEYSGKKYIEINENIPKFTDKDISMVEDYYSNIENGRVRNGNGKD